MPPIYIIPLVYICAIMLLVAITGFSIKNGLVISYTTDRLTWEEEIKLIDIGDGVGRHLEAGEYRRVNGRKRVGRYRGVRRYRRSYSHLLQISILV